MIRVDLKKERIWNGDTEEIQPASDDAIYLDDILDKIV